MKHNYLLRLQTLIAFSVLFTMTYAAEWYISSTGNDTSGDGSMGNPWASFSKAQTAAGAGDTINVSGMIDMWSDPANSTYTAITGGLSTTNKTGIALAKSLTIQGTSAATDGFEGKNGTNSTRFFQITNSAYTLTLKNLKLANGTVESTSATTGGGAITMSNGNIIAENVIFDSNIATGNNNITGAALYIGGTNASGTSFTNCVFSNNASSKAGAIYINNWAAGTASVPSIIQFVGCTFIANEAKLTFGGSALFIRSANNFTTCNIINCTFAKNKVHNAGANGGTINLGAKAMGSTTVNIINCTITENTTGGSPANTAGVFMLNTTANCIGNLYIKNTIIEGNTASDGTYADLGVAAVSPITPDGGSSTVPGYIKIENSIIGRCATDASRVAADNVPAPNHYNYLTNTSTTNDLKAGLAPFNATTNSYSLYTTSAAIGYGNSSLLSAYSLTDQLGNVRTVGATNTAGAIETTPLATTTPSAPTSLVATPGDGQISVAFISAATGGSLITNYKYSVNDGAYMALDPAVITSPLVITGLSNNTEYTVKLKAVNANGESPESVASNAVTPSGTTQLNDDLNHSVKIYRNSDNQIVITNSSLKTGEITVYNSVGQLVASANLSGISTTINKSMNSGIYVILVNIEGKTRSEKLIF